MAEEFVSMIRNGKESKCKIQSLATVKKRVEKFLADNELGPKDPINKVQLRSADQNLFYQLCLHSYLLSGKMNATPALLKMGFSTPVKSDYEMSTVQVEEYIRQAIPKETAEEIYSGHRRVYLKKHFRNCGKLVWQAYRGCTANGRSDFRRGRLVEIINSLYPDLQEKYNGKKLYPLLRERRLTESYLHDNLRKLYFDEKSISNSGLRAQPNGRKMVYAIGCSSADRQMELFENEANFMKKAARLMGIKGLSHSDLCMDGQDATTCIGNIAEGQLLFLLAAVMKYDPKCRAMGSEFREIFGSEIHEIFSKNEIDRVALPGSPDEFFSDGRLISAKGDLLLEVKVQQSLDRRGVPNVIKKYEKQNYWADGGKIDRKIMLIYTPDERLRNNLANSEQFTLIAGEQFSEFYSKAIELIRKNEPGFFCSAKIPVSSDTLLHINDIVCGKPHLLLERNKRWMRQWAAKMLSENYECLLSGERVPGRQKFDYEYIAPFEDFRNFYGKKQTSHWKKTA